MLLCFPVTALRIQAITKQELRTVAVLAAIFALRMLGLCMLMPIFAVEALKYRHATPQLIGFAVGIYGLAQATLQVPFGALSDRYGRKPLILLGLVLITLGSLLAAGAGSIYGLISGRLLQGCGSIGSVVLATMIDNVRAQVRTSAMAILGASIGVAFALALVIGPWLNHYLGLTGVFVVIAMLAVICSGLVLTIPRGEGTLAQTLKKFTFLQGLRQTFVAQLLPVNVGVFVLHANLAALFLIMPILLQSAGISAAKLWQFYLGTIFAAMLVAWRGIKYAERQQNMERFQMLAIIGLLFAELLLYTINSWFGIAGILVVFFSAFCILEASLPALVSKYAAAENRGTALGMYACLQFLGVFVGGTCGGWVHGQFGVMAVLTLCVLLISSWLFLYTSSQLRRKLWLEV